MSGFSTVGYLFEIKTDRLNHYSALLNAEMKSPRFIDLCLLTGKFNVLASIYG